MRDLAAAVQDYNALGFTVVPGGEHTDGASYNTLVAFANGSYLAAMNGTTCSFKLTTSARKAVTSSFSSCFRLLISLAYRGSSSTAKLNIYVSTPG